MNKTTKRDGSSAALSAVIAVLAVLLAGAIGFICYMLFGGRLAEGEKQNGGADDSGAGIVETPPDEETQALYDTVVMKIGDVEFDYELYRGYFYPRMRRYDGGELSYWQTSEGASSLAALREEIQKEFVTIAAVKMLAAKHGVTLSEETMKELDRDFDGAISQLQAAYGCSATSLFSSYKMTLQYFKETEFLIPALEEALYEKVTAKNGGEVDYSDAALAESAKEFYHVKYILYANDEASSENAAMEKAQATVEALKAIENQQERFDKFDERMRTDSAAYQPTGDNFFYYRRGDFDEEFQAAVDTVGENEISEAVKTRHGYLVVLRLPLNMVYFKDEVYPAFKYNELLTEYGKTLTVTTTDFYDTITPETLK